MISANKAGTRIPATARKEEDKMALNYTESCTWALTAWALFHVQNSFKQC